MPRSMGSRARGSRVLGSRANGLTRRAFQLALTAAAADLVACGGEAGRASPKPGPPPARAPDLAASSRGSAAPARGASEPDPERVEIGVQLPLSGPESALGLEVQRGILLATGPRPLHLGFHDAAQGSAPAVFAELVDGQRPLAAIGELGSARTKALVSEATRRRVPLVTPTATAPGLGGDSAWLFRACLDDAQLAQAAAERAAARGAKRIGLAWAEDDALSAAMIDAFKAEAQARGLRVVHEARFLGAETSLTVHARALKARSVDLVYAPILWRQAAPLLAQARAEGLSSETFLGSDAWIGDASALAALEGAFAVDHFVAGAPWTGARAFDARYRERFQSPPTSLAALGFDAVTLVYDALLRALQPTAEAMRDALAGARDVPCASGLTSIARDGAAEKPCCVVALRGGAPRFEALVGANAKATLAS